MSILLFIFGSMSNKRPTTEESLYGKEMYDKGYAKGYKQALWDLNKIKSKREYNSFRQFGKFWDKIEDKLAEQRKK